MRNVKLNGKKTHVDFDAWFIKFYICTNVYKWLWESPDRSPFIIHTQANKLHTLNEIDVMADNVGEAQN